MSTAPSIDQSDLLRTETLPKRVFGKTGEEAPILGLGTAPGGMGLLDTAEKWKDHYGPAR